MYRLCCVSCYHLRTCWILAVNCWLMKSSNDGQLTSKLNFLIPCWSTVVNMAFKVRQKYGYHSDKWNYLYKRTRDKRWTCCMVLTTLWKQPHAHFHSVRLCIPSDQFICHAGAVMFLFRGEFGCLLYTGDFRWERYSERANKARAMLSDALGNNVVDTVYLDNTYCNPSYVFPSREVAAQQVNIWISFISIVSSLASVQKQIHVNQWTPCFFIRPLMN